MPLTAPGIPRRIPRRRGLFITAGMIFALGMVAGAAMRPLLPTAVSAPVTAAFAAASAPPLQADPPIAKRLDPDLVYPAEVLRVIDGDTFEARVRVWPGLDVDTHVRLRGIDAAELHARCADELAKAQAARTALQALLDKATSPSRASASTNTAGGSTPWWRRAAPPTCRRRCSRVASRAPITAASADRGAGDRDQKSGIRDQENGISDAHDS